jgi:hypothetical protein
MTRVRTPDEFADITVDGELVAGPVSTEYDSQKKRRVRWMTATLYLKSDETYVLHQVNISRVWHTEAGTGHVRKPEERDAEQFFRAVDAVYCGDLPYRGRPQCPLRSRGRSSSVPRRVIIELDQHRLTSFPDEATVITGVMTARRGDGSVSVALSEPMRELLAEAAEKIPAFDTARPVISM